MPLSPGTRLGSYEIVAPLGAGGMGEVYRARDAVLKREVALKVLPAALAHDLERMARFQREAELLASLNHPNIAIIHGLVESDGQRALVMELVPGETLGARIKRGSMPLEEALNVSRQIAEALEAAHEKGVVHRDLKPGNVMITPDGLVKVLDFGLAAIVHATPSTPADPVNSPTLTMNMTQAGVILGTAAYMSPEQAAGTPVDKRADIWSYGVVLWEMLSAKRLFGGDTIAHTLADVLRGPIDFDKVTAPAPIKNLLRRCLDRDPKTRLRDIGEARVAIAKVLADPESGTDLPQQGRARTTWVAWVAAAILGVVAILGWIRARPEQANAAAELALTIAAPNGSLAKVGRFDATPQISPDGSSVIFRGPPGVQLRRLNTLDPEPLRASGILENPGFWSPDSKTYLFADVDSLRKMRVPDGGAELISKGVVGPTNGGSVSDSGTILVTGVRQGFYMLSAAGKEMKPVEVAGLPEGLLVWPEFLPGSEDFLFLHVPPSEERGVYLATLRDGKATDPVLLMRNETAASYTPAGGGRLLFVRDDNLYAQRLNRTAKRLEGDPELIQRSVASSPSFFQAHFTVARTGAVAWRPGRAGLSQVTIFNRQGKEIGVAGSSTMVQTLRLAPDETRLLLAYLGRAWLLEPGQPGQQPLEQGSLNTLWSPDGSKFLDLITGAKGPRLVERPVSGGAVGDLAAAPPGMERPLDVSRDGKTLLFNRGAMDTAVFSMRLDVVKEDPRSLVQTGEVLSNTTFAPDSNWIVYQTSGHGSEAIYVQPFPGPGLKRTQIASSGNWPVWRKDGREIVYLDQHQGRDYIWSVSVAPAGGELHPSPPTPLFPVRLPASTFSDLNFLVVSRDGSRFYIPQAVEQLGSDVIHVRMGWVK